MNVVGLAPAASAQVTDRSLGNLKAVRALADGLELYTDFGKLQVRIYAATVVRIELAQAESFSTASYTVVARPQPMPWRWKRFSDSIIITTDSLRMVLRTRPVRISFYTPENRLISADDPRLGTAWAGNAVTVYKQLHAEEVFVGLGEKTGNLNRRGSAYVNWNSDVPAYSLNQDPLYASIPFYMGFHDSLCYGIFLDNSSRSHFNFGASQNRFSSFSTEDGPMRYFFIYHSNPRDIVRAYSWLTGRMPLPPLWALGYHQCRWSYYPEAQVLNLANTFRQRRFPCDAIWLDIHYMDAYKVFTWHPQHFPNPKRMLDSLQASGFRTVVILDPGIKVESGYAAYDTSSARKLLLTYPDGTEYHGQVWPGWCAFPDFSNPQARRWWGDELRHMTAAGVDGYWCDMNEIATWGQNTPLNVRFHGDGKPFSYRLGKNVYGLLMTQATYEGALRAKPNQRPFLLTRAGFAGLQRYSAIWTGDNVSDEQHMMLGIRLLNALGLSGVPFCGVDVGGFIGTASPSLMARWMSLGAFSPFFRSHKEINGPAAEPWAFNEHTEQVARQYTLLRYRLLPYLYSSFREASLTGLPVQRSLALYYPHNPEIYTGHTQHQYLFGDALMVVPVMPSQAYTPMYLPDGIWYDLHTGTRLTGPAHRVVSAPTEKLPLFARGGNFLFLQSAIQHTDQQPADTLFVHAFFGTTPSPQLYYEDAGDGFAYLQGDYWQRNFTTDTASRKIHLSAVEGHYPSRFAFIKFFLYGFPPESRFFFDNQPLTTKEERFKFIEMAEPHSVPKAITFTLPHRTKAMTIRYQPAQ